MSYRERMSWEDDDPKPLIDLSDWDIPQTAYLPSLLLSAVMVVGWLFYAGSDGMSDWGVSASALSQGRFETIPLHLIAHAGFIHLSFNVLVLVQIGGPLATCLGNGWRKWLRFISLMALSGLVGMAFFLSIHPTGSVPMIGASGAIYGLLGLLLRVRDQHGEVVPLVSEQMKNGAVEFVKTNFLLILILTLPAILLGGGGGVAWESHLGGFLFGVLVGPRFISRSENRRSPDEEADLTTSV